MNQGYYAIKTEDGYLARRGTEKWIQSNATGWALFGTKEDALKLAEYYSNGYDCPFSQYHIIQV